MERRTYEFGVAGVLVLIVAALCLFRYHQSRDGFLLVDSLQLTGAVNVARLDQPQSGRLNINTASFAELDALPGISSNIARSIIVYRHNQPFTDFAELTRIPGIGPKRLASIADLVFCGDTYDQKQ